MKKVFFLTALLCASVMGFADPVTGSSTEKSDGNDFVNGYDYSFSTSGTTVTISFTEKEDYVGLVAYLWNYTNGFAETPMTVSGHTATIALEDQTAGVELRFACKFAYAGGMSVTKQFTYVVPASGKTDPGLNVYVTEKTLDASETFQIEATQSGDGAISYASSNEDIASVSSTGLITAVGRGTATITVSTEETENYEAASKKITVTVNGPINWNAVSWLGNGTGDEAYTDKYKAVSSPSGMTINNLQSNAEKKCIHVICPSAEFGACSLEASDYHAEGAGLFLHLDAFTAQETQFTLVCGGTTYTFDVYNANSTATAVDNVTSEGQAMKVLENGQLVIIRNGMRYNAAGQYLK
ncbi:MAG: Ig-like domain-containing protein [Paludibacteraceae bacterium]